MRTRIRPLLILTLLLGWTVPALALRVGVAPLAGSGLTMDQARVARSLLVHNLQKELPEDLVVELRGESWMALSPVLELLGEARGQKLDRIVLVSADQLGEKLTLQLRVLQVSDERNLFTDSMPVASVEDLATAMQRAAMAVAHGKTLDDVREVGQVLENEGLKTRHRTALRQATLQAGYLWPLSDEAVDKSERNYDGHSRRFAFALSSGIEDRNFDAGYTLAWRYGPAVQLYSDWLFRVQDFCPYLGVCRAWTLDGVRVPVEAGFSEISQRILGVCARKLRKIRAGWDDEARQAAKSDRLLGAGLGFHWVLDKKPDGEYRMDDGFHLAARTGVILFRTYDFQMSLEGGYLVTWNEDIDRAWLLSLGIRP